MSSAMSKVRLVIKVDQYRQSYEVFMSAKLSLSENLGLLFGDIGRGMSDYIVIVKDEAAILDTEVPIKDFGLLDGTVLYLYNFTKRGSCLKPFFWSWDEFMALNLKDAGKGSLTLKPSSLTYSPRVVEWQWQVVQLSQK